MKRILSLILAAVLAGTMVSCGSQTPPEQSQQSTPPPASSQQGQEEQPQIPEHFILVEGGTFSMGSPNSEAWRSGDEAQHTVTVSDSYMSVFEVTQAEYQAVTGSNPSAFSGEDLPVETVSWLDAVAYHALKPVLFEMPTYEYLKTGEVLGKCMTLHEKK